MEIVLKSRMEIAYANRVWKSYTGASFANFDSADLLEIAHGNRIEIAYGNRVCKSRMQLRPAYKRRQNEATFSTKAWKAPIQQHVLRPQWLVGAMAVASKIGGVARQKKRFIWRSMFGPSATTTRGGNGFQFTPCGGRTLESIPE